MPYKVKIEEPKGKTSESLTKGFAQMKRELGGSTGGEVVSGAIGEVEQEPKVEAEELTKQGEKQRQSYIDLLQVALIPHRLGKLSTVEENRERLFSKLDRLTLGELMRFVPSKVKVGEIDTQSISTSIRAEINMRYKDISP